MKKFLSLAIIIFMCLTISGCGYGYYNKSTEFYNKDVLTSLGLEDLPKPKYQHTYHTSYSRDIYGMMEENEFYAYASVVLNYLKSEYQYVETYDPKEKLVKHTGFKILEAEGKLEDYIQNEYDENNNLISTEYNFVYFNEEDLLNVNGETPNCLTLTYFYSVSIIDSKEFNFIIDLPKGTIFYEVYLFSASYDDISGTDVYNLYLYYEKYPFYFVLEEIKEYNQIIESSSSKEDALNNAINFETENGLVVEKAEIIAESKLYYGIKISFKTEESEKEMKVISFKKDKFDYTNNKIITDDDNEIRKILSTVTYFKTKDTTTKVIHSEYSKSGEISTFILEVVVFDEESEYNLKYIVTYYEVDKANDSIEKTYESIREKGNLNLEG